MGATTSVQSRLGRRLRALRTERGLSIRALAGRTGFSPSFISQVESDTTSISIGSLQSVLAELGVTMGEFFTDLEATSRVVVRRGDRTRYESAWSRGAVEVLTDGGPERKLSAIEVTVGAGGTSGTRSEQRHDTLFIVLTGALTVHMAGQPLALQEGDAAYLPEGAAIGWENPGQTTATAIVVSAAPLPAHVVGVIATAIDGDRPPRRPVAPD